jgi:hypothetical protein
MGPGDMCRLNDRHHHIHTIGPEQGRALPLSSGWTTLPPQLKRDIAPALCSRAVVGRVLMGATRWPG